MLFSPVNGLKSRWTKICLTCLVCLLVDGGEKKISPPKTLNQLGLITSKFSLTTQEAAVMTWDGWITVPPQNSLGPSKTTADGKAPHWVSVPPRAYGVSLVTSPLTKLPVISEIKKFLESAKKFNFTKNYKKNYRLQWKLAIQTFPITLFADYWLFAMNSYWITFSQNLYWNWKKKLNNVI